MSHVPHATHGLGAPTAPAKPDDAHTAAKQLEAFFTRRLLAEAQPDGGGMLDGGFAGDTFKQMFNEALADKMSSGSGLGMSELFAQQLEKKGTSAQPQAQPPTALAKASPVQAMPAQLAPGLPGLDRSAPPFGAVAGQGQALAVEDAPHFVLPVQGTPTSGFGTRIDPIKGTTSVHPGFDLAAKVGTPVSAAAAGTVVHAGPAGTYGNLVTIRHDGGYETRYAHLSAVSVKVGDRVDAGAPVGAVGTTGYSTGPHLHFEVRHDGTTVDPAPLLPLNRSKARTIR